MSDRAYVQATVAYLADHDINLHRHFLAYWNNSIWGRSGPWTGKWIRARKYLVRLLNPKVDPLVSADWWEENGNRKLADLLRKQVETVELGPLDWTT